MRTLALLPLLLLCACPGKQRPGVYLLDREALARALQYDAGAGRKVGGDADPRFDAKPGDKHYIPWKHREGRQVHLYSQQRRRTTVVDGVALRKQTRIVVIAQYEGYPPPPPGLTRRKP